MIIGDVKDWHSPNNPECANNQSIESDCNCKLVIPHTGKKRRQKPRITFRVVDHTVTGHKVKPELVAELHDDGTLFIRESRRRTSYQTTLGKIYCRLVWNVAVQAAGERRRARQAARPSARISKRKANRIARRAK